MTASKALKLGIVDCLFDSTQSLPEGGGGEKGGHAKSYKYQWLSCILDCVEKGQLGDKPLVLEYGNGTDAVGVGIGKDQDAISEQELWDRFGSCLWQSEAKVRLKYPRVAGMLAPMATHLMDSAAYVVAAFQTWGKIGATMPAPYACLKTTFQCCHVPDWAQAMTMNAVGFSSVASTAEAKGLMGLFLLSRRLKRFALTYGVEFRDVPVKFDVTSALVVVMVSSEWARYPIAFAQGLLHAGHTVAMVPISGGLDCDQLVEEVRQHFGYSLKRGHLTMEEVEGKMKRLLCLQSDLPGKVLEGVASVVVVNAAGVDTYASKIESIVASVKKNKELKVRLEGREDGGRGNDL